MQEIQVWSSNFRTEIEGYWANAEKTFAGLGENLKNMLNQVNVKLLENDGRNNHIEQLLMQIMNQNEMREKENQEMNNSIAMMNENMGNKNICLPLTNRRSRKN